MSDARSSVNRAGGEGETPIPDEFAALARVDEEMPPPPRPLPDTVAQMAAGLLVPPERAGPAGLPVVAGYELLAPLGHGGMGLVYQARQVTSGRMVALKMIPGGAHARPGDLARFRTEAEAVSRLAHPHIVQIYEVGEQGGWAYFALEFVPGGSLARHLAGRPQPAVASARLVEAVARAMAYAHERGVVHRDLKPGNILLEGGEWRVESGEWRVESGVESDTLTTHNSPRSTLHAPLSTLQPKITDFGLAKRLDLDPETSPSRGRTRTGDVLGT